MLLGSSAEPFKYFINPRDNRYRCLDFKPTHGQRQQQDHQCIGACLVVPPSHRGYQQGKPTPHLVSRLLLESSTFVVWQISRDTSRGQALQYIGSTLPVVPDDIPLAGTVGSLDFLPLRTTVAWVPKAELQSRHQVEPRGLLLDISHLR